MYLCFDILPYLGNFDSEMTEGEAFISEIINRILHRSPKQTEKSHPEVKRIMPEKNLPSFQHYPLIRRLKISRSASEADV